MRKKKSDGLWKGWIAVVVCLCCLMFPAFAAKTQAAARVGCFPLNGFFDFEEQTGKISGYGADYTEAVFHQLGQDYEYVRYASWVEALDALSRNEIDLLAPAQHTAERDAIYEFDSFPISTEYGTLLALSTNDDLIYEDYQAYQGLSVGVVPSLIFLDKFQEYEKRNDFHVALTYYKDTAALVAALKAGEVDAILANMMVKTDDMKLLARFGAAPVYYMLSPDAKGMQEELNLAIDRLSSEHPELQNELSALYFSDFNQLPFSKEELDYIAACATLPVACRSDYVPLSYADAQTGEPDGAEIAILRRIAELSGLSFSFEPVSETETAQTKGFALVAGAENAAEAQDGVFSESYLTIPRYFVGPQGMSLDTGKNNIIAVAGTQGAQVESVKRMYPDFRFDFYPTIEQCIQAVHSGAADFLLGDRYAMEIMLASPGNADLKLLPTEVPPANLCVQVLLADGQEDILAAVLNKAVELLSEEEKERFLNEYSQKNRYQYSVSDFFYQYRAQMIVTGLVLLLIAVGLFFLYRTRKKAQLAVAENEMKLRHITNNINGGVIVLVENEGLNITFANDGFLELIGCTREEFDTAGSGSYKAYVHPQDLQLLKKAIHSKKKELSLELRVQKKDGTYVPALFNCTAAEKNNGTLELYCVILDMTEQNKLLEKLRVDKRRTDLILERVDEIFYEIDLRDQSISTSLSFFQKMGWKLPDRLPDDPSEYGNMWHTDDENIEKLRLSTVEMQQKKEPVSAIILLRSEMENRFVWCEIFQHPILAKDGSIITVIGLIRNVDEQVSERERLLEQAQRDLLTGLYNKETFETIVTDTLRKMPTQNHALIFIDLDHFKNVNDTLGHLTGDQAICDAADKLKIIFSNFDVLSRFGGDEFCIFVKNIPFETIKGKMDWLIEKMHQTYCGEKGTVPITCSCGIACTEYVGYEYETLMQRADESLYYSKEQGRDRYTFYKEIEKNWQTSRNEAAPHA